MSDDATITAALIELDGIANAPMTAWQRLRRAEPVLSSASLTVQDLVAAVRREDLSWAGLKTSALKITAREWQDALRLSGILESSDLRGFLGAMHRADAAAAMVRAGYKGSRDASGNVTWSR